MKRVFKYQLEVKDYQTIEMPISLSENLCDNVVLCAVQNDVPCLWVMVDDSKPNREFEITIHGTGHDATDTEPLRHIGSFMLFDGKFVGHVFA